MMVVNHRFYNESFFFPNWDIDILILGTFNPASDTIVDYYYGRERNKFWRAIESINGLSKKFLHENFEEKKSLMLAKKFGCVDIIKYVDVDETHLVNILGNGYSDSALFIKRKVKLTYQFEDIKAYLLEKKVLKVVNTWGKRKSPKFFKDELLCLKTFCEENGIIYIENCPSPSGRSNSNVDYIANFYTENVF